MDDEAPETRSAAVEGFAAVLRDLRESAGNPSYREMAGRSQAISHTTLHEAAQGNRLPSWPTTVEFVKACAADPAAYRERWMEAQRASAAVSDRRDVAPPEGGRRADDLSGDGHDDASTAKAPSEGRRRVGRRLALAGALAAALVAVGVAAWARGGDSGSGPHTVPPTSRSTAIAAATSASSEDCPIKQHNPPSAPPRHRGDVGVFLADVTLPDCTRVPPTHTVDKRWRFKNAGTVPWRGYSLHRMDPNGRKTCQTIADVPVPDTEPGHQVEIEVTVTTPAEPTFCFVRFKMVDADGHLAFPGSRPVNFQVVVS